MPKDIELRTQNAIAEGVFPGCVIGIVRKSGRRDVLPYGRLTYAPDAPFVREDTMYDLASVTKSIPVASLALVLAEERRLSFRDKVVTFIPELHNDYAATIEDLLRYRVAGPRLSTLPFTTFEEVRTHVLEKGFDGPPGQERYANVPAFLLGIVIERISGMTLPALAEKYLFGPLSMRDTTFFPHDIARTAPTEIVGGKEVHGIVHDESARLFAHKRHAVGHAGLFSTAPDMLNFLEALVAGDYRSVLHGAEHGLGWQTSGEFLGTRGKRRFGKTGFTGTSILLDRRASAGLVLLSNRTYPTRPADSAAINAFRADIANIVFA